MEVLPEGPLASILLLIPIREGDTVSVACRYWNRVLRDIVHGTMTSEINIRNAGTVVTIQAIAAQFRSLTSLDLSGCDQESDVGVQAIGAGCPRLTSLTISNCVQVSDVEV